MLNVKIGYVSDYRHIGKVATDLSKASIVGCDTETTSLDSLTGKIRLIQIATSDAVWVLDMFKLPKQLVKEKILEPLFTNENVVKVFQNGKFDLKFIQTNFDFGLHEIRTMFDTYLAAKLLIGGQVGGNFGCGLDDLAERHLGVHLDKSFQKFDWSGNLYKEPIAYAGLDAAILLPLYRLLAKSLEENKLLKVAKLEFECVPALAQLELNGILVDKTAWLDIAEKGKEEMYQYELAMREFFGDINVGSTQQVCKVLSEITGMDVKSSSKDSLTNLIKNYYEKPDLFGKVVDYRIPVMRLQAYNSVKKMQSSFGIEFLKHIHKVTGRLHPEVTQIETNTARNSQRDPNLQQIPRDSYMRAAFVAAEGHKIWNADYSQIELRGMAQFTKDEGYVHAFENKLDLHSATAASMFHIPIENVTSDQRHAGKTINFGVPYGMGAPRYSVALDIPIEQAKKELKAFYNAHPGLVQWHQDQFEYFKRYSCVRSASGRIRALPNWRYDEYAAQQAAKNFPIQSTAADITKLAMVRCFRELPRDVKLVNVVHDELLHEVPEKDVKEIGPEIDRLMRESAEEFIPDIPIIVEGHAADCWSKG